ncbi:sensor histidine kinase [Paracoccus aminovorans]|uniref:sensor histidine kinase n=1 Tax=Paracoccus aminovorans TaxID=34004 RepID=UPI002B25B39E|nr:HAMP domain-containing sensor histidine kinase [Paracoccus aminovorans]
MTGWREILRKAPNWRAILRTTPMRLTLRLVVIFTVISIAGFAATWWLADKEFREAVEETLERRIESLADAGDADDIARAVFDAAGRSDGEHMILRYDRGALSIGNYRGPLPEGRLREAMLEDDDNDVEGSYLLLTEKVEGGLLTAGQEASALRNLREVFWRVLVFTLLPTILLAALGGVVMARRAARRSAAIDEALARLTAGDLSARVTQMPGPPDDLARIGAGLDRLAAAQQASVSALKQVSADIAHDLKTPVQRLSVLLEQAAARAPEIAELDKARAEAEGIVVTFQALLRIAQIEGGSPRARFAPVDLGALARTMAELYEPAAEESGRSLILMVRDAAWVQGDRTLLGQVLAKLIENALRHGAGPVEVTVEGAMITVADHGPGIPDDERQAVLRRLYRLDRSRTTPGNGLGLAMVDAVVKLHDGKLELGNNAPGLKVVVTLKSASPGRMTDM